MSAQTVDFHLFIRSGRGAAHSQCGCLNLTIVSFLSWPFIPLSLSLWRSTLEGRLCECWKFLRTSLRYWVYKEKHNLVSRRFPTGYNAGFAEFRIHLRWAPLCSGSDFGPDGNREQISNCRPLIPGFPTGPVRFHQRIDLTSFLSTCQVF